MEQQRFDYLVNELHEFEGMEEIFVLDANGNILFKSEDFQLSDEEAKAILKAWKEKESALLLI